ncbi:uncharacterized protein LOC116845880 isoform X1 [Odontomachus brunneus]|uniref:uncharacterized protein LOC116845880 isoform X1 n=1 Tax=Odontomachus brunneus TaxID=486640 RepID=UPI0013F18346|nr:uncharacterized protein LOC116845880 isoform X1 [Odontomachus brunneus]
MLRVAHAAHIKTLQTSRSTCRRATSADVTNAGHTFDMRSRNCDYKTRERTTTGRPLVGSMSDLVRPHSFAITTFHRPHRIDASDAENPIQRQNKYCRSVLFYSHGTLVSERPTRNRRNEVLAEESTLGNERSANG